jgi:hypothetical protein
LVIVAQEFGVAVDVETLEVCESILRAQASWELLGCWQTFASSDQQQTTAWHTLRPTDSVSPTAPSCCDLRRM